MRYIQRLVNLEPDDFVSLPLQTRFKSSNKLSRLTAAAKFTYRIYALVMQLNSVHIFAIN